MKLWRLLPLVLLAGCASGYPVPPPDPILPTDAVKDIETALQRANEHCKPDPHVTFGVRDGKLIGETWLFSADTGGEIHFAKVFKGSGFVDCSMVIYR